MMRTGNLDFSLLATKNVIIRTVIETNTNSIKPRDMPYMSTANSDIVVNQAFRRVVCATSGLEVNLLPTVQTAPLSI